MIISKTSLRAAGIALTLLLTGAPAGMASAADSAPHSPPVETVEIGAVTVRLWYEGTGRLSDNVAPPSTFALWNTIIGEGDAEEPAEDALVTVEVIAPPDISILSGNLTLTARDPKGKVIARRSYPMVSLSKAGRAYKGLWLTDVGCAGAVEITASLGQSRKVVKVDFACGE